jgi:hypothetical protein
VNLTLSRRAWLAFAGSTAAVLALPRLGVAASAKIPRRAKRVLVINLSGGVRSSAAFLASSAKPLNPWGLIEGAPIPLGRLLDDHVEGQQPPPPQLYQLRDGAFANERITPFRELGSRIAVVGTWDPERGDHSRSERVMATGGTSAAAPGLVVRLFAGLSGTLGKEAPETPPFVLGAATSIGAAPGPYARFAAVDITDPTRLPNAAQGTGAAKVGRGFSPNDAARGRLDEAFSAKTGPAGRELVDTYALDQRMSVRLGQLLSSPAVSLTRGGEGSLGKVRVGKRELPFTNEMLLDALAIVQRTGRGFSPFGGQTTDPTLEAATAVRLLQVGSPAVAINLTGYDAHSGERQGAPHVYGQLGALFASLHFILSRVVEPDEPGATMLDRTLIVTTSEFGRDPGQPRTGFNGGDGSDHGSHPACFYLAHGVMGAGISGGRVFGGVSTETYDARKETTRFAPRQLLATIAYAMGIDPAHPQYGFEGATPIDLWSTK